MGGPLDDHLGHPDRRFVGERVKDVVSLNPTHLVGDGVDDLGPAMPDLAVPEAAQAIDVVLPGVVPDEGTLAADDVHEVGFRFGGWSKGVEQGAGHRKGLLVGSVGIPGRTGRRSSGRVSIAPMESKSPMVTAVAVQATVSPWAA